MVLHGIPSGHHRVPDGKPISGAVVWPSRKRTLGAYDFARVDA